MKRQTVSPAALRAMAVKNTKASARLEGREVPEGHVRSQAVEQYIAEHTSKTAGGCTSRLGPAPDTEAAEAFHPQTDSGAGELLNILASDLATVGRQLTDHQGRPGTVARRPGGKLIRSSSGIGADGFEHLDGSTPFGHDVGETHAVANGRSIHPYVREMVLLVCVARKGNQPCRGKDAAQHFQGRGMEPLPGHVAMLSLPREGVGS